MATMSISHLSDTNVIGLRGQKLGQTDHLIIDMSSGSITHLVLSTDWQKITIPWGAVQFDCDQQAFKMVRPRKPPPG